MAKLKDIHTSPFVRRTEVPSALEMSTPPIASLGLLSRQLLLPTVPSTILPTPSQTRLALPKPEPVVLYNRARYKSFQFTIHHAIACKAAGACFCGTVPLMGADKLGETTRAERSVFIPARGYSPPLPREVLLLPAVKCALAEPRFLEVANRLAEIQVIEPR